MGKHKRRSQQAKTQHMAGQGCFGSAFTDDPFDDMVDPDFELTASENEDKYAMRKYRSHRKIGPIVMMNVAALHNPA